MNGQKFCKVHAPYIEAMKTGKKCRFWDFIGDYHVGLPSGFTISSNLAIFYCEDDENGYKHYEVIQQVPYLKSMTECMRWIEDNGGRYIGMGKFTWDCGKPIPVYADNSEGSVHENDFDLWGMCGKKFTSSVWVPKDLIEWRDE